MTPLFFLKIKPTRMCGFSLKFRSSLFKGLRVWSEPMVLMVLGVSETSEEIFCFLPLGIAEHIGGCSLFADNTFVHIHNIG